MPQGAVDIASYFVRKYGRTPGSSLTNMKLLKLVYIAHGWCSGITNQRLISEDVQAWRYGPVIPSVYHAFKLFGTRPVNPNYVEEEPALAEGRVDPAYHDLLDRIWQVYGHMDGLQLSALTHGDDTPWKRTWDACRGGRNQIIPWESIRDHYKAKLQESAS